jgi:peroxiredoxin Q/BCP
MNLQNGQLAPEFELPDQDGKIHQLSDYKGKWLLLYFYPQDDTSGCTKEACSMRDNLPNFGKINAEVLGVSADSVESHKNFEKKYQLTFTLLSDTKKIAINKYGVWENGIKRTSFLINPAGEIAKIYEQVNPEIHAAQVLADLAELTK